MQEKLENVFVSKTLAPYNILLIKFSIRISIFMILDLVLFFLLIFFFLKVDNILHTVNNKGLDRNLNPGGFFLLSSYLNLQIPWG